MKRMLINATQAEELRVALVDGQRLSDLDIEATGKEQKKSNIYKGKIIRLEPSLEAAFVDFGANRHGFLPLKEISRKYFKTTDSSGNGRANIKSLLKEGQELIVQVEKEERGNKGAALTTFLSLAGRYLVAMPNNPRAGGVSRQIEGQERTEAQEAMAELTIPEDMGVILRTAGVDKSTEELQWDLDYLNQIWTAIDDAAAQRQAPVLIFQDSNVIIRAIRDYLRNDILEILVDDKGLYDQAHDFMEQVMPHNLSKLKLYEDSVPLFNRYQIESQIETAFSRTIRLPSGGSLVIEPTEALTTVDINSARATQGSDIEETALRTNLEAAEEIGRQLRLRDLGGLLVIDFIDMLSNKNQRSVENRLRDSVKIDRARIQIGRISRFGLLEMSRQRLRPSLADSSYELCVNCDGIGSTRNNKSTALGVLRLIEEEAMKASTSTVYANVSIAVATFLVNEKRLEVTAIEARHSVRVVLIPNDELQASHFDVQREREQDAAKSDASEGYRIHNDQESARDTKTNNQTNVKAEKPLVSGIKHGKKKPKPKSKTAKGLVSRLLATILSIFTSNSKPKRSNRNRRTNNLSRRSERPTRTNKKRSPNSDAKPNGPRSRSANGTSDSKSSRTNGNTEKETVSTETRNNRRRRKRPEQTTRGQNENVDASENIQENVIVDDTSFTASVTNSEDISSFGDELTKKKAYHEFTLTADEQQRINAGTQENQQESRTDTDTPNNTLERTMAATHSVESTDGENHEDPYLITENRGSSEALVSANLEGEKSLNNEVQDMAQEADGTSIQTKPTKIHYSYGAKPEPSLASTQHDDNSNNEKHSESGLETEENRDYEDDVNGNR